eukprot:2926585-Rhodomonas_salina.2
MVQPLSKAVEKYRNSHKQAGREPRYKALSAYARATPCPVLRLHMVVKSSPRSKHEQLRFPYTLYQACCRRSEIGYGANG